MIKDFDKYFAGVLESESGFKKKPTQTEHNPFEDIMDFTEGKPEKPKIGKEKFDDVMTIL